MVAAAAACAFVAAATPAFAHASFPGATNPAGTATNPYPAASQQTIKMNVPFEQDGVEFAGAENTTTDVKVTAPTGWTKAACGDVRKTGYGEIVSGWLCTVSTEGGRQVLHWTGAQVAAGRTSDDSAQYFTFLVTTPSPSAKTVYGASGASADGFRVVQKYADGATATWRTPNDVDGEVANGLVRAVAAAGGATGRSTASPAATPTSSPTAAPTARPTARPTPTEAPTGAAIDDGLPHTGGGDVSGAWLVAGSSALAVGLVLVATSTPPHRRKPSREGK
jgi:hypothetical protein